MIEIFLKLIKPFIDLGNKIIIFLLLALAGFGSSFVVAQEVMPSSILLHADRIFDGTSLQTNASVLIKNGKIERIGARELFESSPVKALDLGNATLLPGFIELHAHLSYKNVPSYIVGKIIVNKF